MLCSDARSKKKIKEVVTSFSQLLVKNIMTQRFSMHNPIWLRNERHSFMAREVWEKKLLWFWRGPLASLPCYASFSHVQFITSAFILSFVAPIHTCGAVEERESEKERKKTNLCTGNFHILILLPLLPFANKYPILKWHNFARHKFIHIYIYIRFTARRCECRSCCWTLVCVQT